ncbi:Uncharacterised protein [Salmonella enterica subsp. enterica]|uniref:Uncharacterized protein n=1 Tax=Salmonella enterica I TaxID=59201 RepID=A0A379WQY7_SALET|nr:Uncharacterised protein [Salmonella enterica subsp. enterica]
MTNLYKKYNNIKNVKGNELNLSKTLKCQKFSVELKNNNAIMIHKHNFGF